MPDIFDEIGDEIRKDKALLFVKKYGNLLAAAFIAVIAITAVYVSLKTYRHSQAQKAVSEYLNAMKNSSSNSEQTIKQLTDLSYVAPHGVKELTSLKLASSLLESGKKKEAAATYLKIAKDKGADKSFRNIAAISLAKLTLSNPEMAEKKEAEELLKNINSPAEPFFYSALETKAYIELSSGDKTKAAETFSALVNDPQTPQGIKNRAKALAN